MELDPLRQLFQQIAGQSPALQGLLGGVFITLLNTLGAPPPPGEGTGRGRRGARPGLNVGFGAAFYAAVVGIRAGLVEIPLAVGGAWAVGAMEPILPYAMGFAAGAMLYVISNEIIPETHRKGHARLATVGTTLGIMVMLYLDVSLG